MFESYIAYKGEKFTVEWYFDSKGESQSKEYLLKLKPKDQQKIFYLFKRMAEFGKISNIQQFRNEGDDIYAFKPQPERFLSFFVKGKKIIVTNAYRKKTDKIPKNEKELALKCMKDYLKRIEEGTYYED